MSNVNDDNLFNLNPLTLFFVSGVATQLFISLCCNDPLTGYTESPIVKHNTDRRMNRWQTLFYNVCRDFFKSYSYQGEVTFFQSESLDPYITHSQLLVSYSTTILKCCSSKTNIIGQKTFSKVKDWFNLIIKLQSSNIWKKIPKENSIILVDLILQFTLLKNVNVKGQEYVHFSPMSLFIRSMSIVIIHQKEFVSQYIFNEWTGFIALQISDFLNIPQYKKELSTISDITYFTPKFPYIKKMDGKILYDSWNIVAQKSSAVPVHKMFMQILVEIKLHMEHYQQAAKDYREDEVQFVNFQICVDSVQCLLEMDARQVVSCERQRKFHVKKQSNQFDEERRTNECWTCPFVFPCKARSTGTIDHSCAW